MDATGMGLNHTEKDTIALQQYEIKRLRKEVERLNKGNEALQDSNSRLSNSLHFIQRSQDYMETERDTAHNDAIEAMQAHVKPKSITSWDVKEKDYYYALAYEHMWEDLEVMKR